MILKKKIKVLWLASWYPNREDNVYGTFIKKQAVATSAYCELSVLYAHQSEGNAYEIDIQNDPFLEVNIYYPKSTFLFFKWIRYVKALLKGFDEIKNRMGEPELVHVHVVHPVSVLAVYLKFFYKIVAFIFVCSLYDHADRTHRNCFRWGIRKSPDVPSFFRWVLYLHG